MNSGVSSNDRYSSRERQQKEIKEGPPESTGSPLAKQPQAQLPDKAAGISYSPLNEDQDEIRLINILPYTARSSLVRCTLETVSLRSLTSEYRHFASISSSTGRKRVINWTNNYSSSSIRALGEDTIDKHTPSTTSHRFIWGDYAALSYVWGDESQTQSIILNNQEILVRRNLEAALRALSLRPDFQDRYKLWVDAICINQQDLQERARQIRRMQNIYGDARAVIAWLGEEENNSSKAIDLLQRLSSTRRKDCGEELETRLREDPDYLGYGGWMALHDLMCRTYWSRLWIIQEVVLGSAALVLRCGDHFIDWTSFCHAIGVLFEHLWTVKDALLVREVSLRRLEGQRRSTWSTTSLHLVYRDLWGLSQFEEQGGGDRMSFGRLLDVANAADSHDKSDRVYGLVGMMDPIITQNIAPDYQLSPSKVYTAIAKTFICVYRSLEPIREGNPWGQSNSPSWAADWTWDGRNRHARLTAGIYGPFWRQKGHPPNFQPAMPYRASGGKSMEASFSNDDLHLTCRGFLIDEVDGLSAREWGFFSWAENSIDQPESGNNAYGNSDAVVKALYRALVADRVAGGLRASERHAAILSLPSTFATAGSQFERLEWTWLSKQRSYYFRWSRWRLANRHFQVLGKPLDSYFSETIPDGASEYDYTEVYNCADRMIKGRRFMTTTRGYLGWAPDNMFGNDENQVRKGDKVAVIFGCSTPIVIRPHGNYFQVLGEAYIQGLMDGEAVEFLESGQYETRDFIFC